MALPKWPRAAEPAAEAEPNREPRRIGETPTDEEHRARVREVIERVIVERQETLAILAAHDRGGTASGPSDALSEREG